MRTVFVDVPNALARQEILYTYTKKLKLGEDVSVEAIATDERSDVSMRSLFVFSQL